MRLLWCFVFGMFNKVLTTICINQWIIFNEYLIISLSNLLFIWKNSAFHSLVLLSLLVITKPLQDILWNMHTALSGMVLLWWYLTFLICSYEWRYIFQGLYSLKKHRLIDVGIPIINLRRSTDRLRFIMGIPTIPFLHLQRPWVASQ